MDRPLIIMLNETKMDMVSVINNAMKNNIPCYLLEPIMSELLHSIKEGARNELQMATEHMANEQSNTDVVEE